MSDASREPRPRAADLSFRVFGKALHPEWFAVKARRRVAKDDWAAELWVVDQGHVVLWRSGPIRVTEVLADRRTALPSEGLLFESPVMGDRRTSLRPGRGIEYQSSFEAERVDREVFAHLSEELVLDVRRAAVAHEFSGSNRLAAPARGQLVVEARAKGLLVHAFHTFPDERSIVRTQSLFESKLALPAR